MNTSIFDQVFIDSMAEAVAKKLPNRAAETKRLFTLEEAAQYIGRTQKAVERLIERGVIPVTKLDGKRQVDRAVLDKLISDRTYFEVA
jgi:excisionase family DNA binding protein